MGGAVVEGERRVADDLADGTWYFRVMAEDLTGMFSAFSAAGVVLVDTTSPSVPGSASTTSPSADRSPVWVWTAATDAGSGLATDAYQVEWSQDSGFAGGVTADTATGSSFTHTDDLADGTWYFRVRAVDAVGNQSSFAANGTVVVDASAPTTPGTPAPAAAETADVTPSWSWSASTDSGVGLDDPAYELQWSQSSSFAGGVFTSTNNSTNFTHTDDLADGTWYFRVRAVDAVGNESNWSANGVAEVDASVPTTPGSPTTPTPTNDDTPTWTWAASTDSGVGLDTPAYEVQWSQDSGFAGGVTSDTANAASFTHGSGLPDGTWYFRVRAVDVVENRSGWSGTGTVVIDTNAPDTPSGTPTTTTPTSDNTPTWLWTPDMDDSYQLEWTQTSDFSGGVSNGTSATEAFTHSTSLADGTWYFRVRAVDEASNTSSWSAAGTVYIDATAPTVPGTPSTDTPTNNQVPTWTWTASTDSGIGLEEYALEWSGDADFADIIASETTTDTTFEHVDDLGFGVWYFRVRAVDELNNASAWSAVGEVNIDNVPPIISDLTATPRPDGAIITWTTNEIASSQVEYGAGSGLGSTTIEADTSPRVTTHIVTLTGLPACASYSYRVKSTDQLNNQSTSATATFTTTTCSGNAAITAQGTTGISAGSGGQANLQGGSAALSLSVPAGFAGSDADFQVKQLSPAAALGPIGQPAGHYLVGSHVYDLKAIASDNVALTSFNGGLNISITYTAAEIASFNTGSLAIFRWDGSAWQKLNSCQVNTGNRSVNCTTSNFSVFGLFGVRATPAPAPELPEGDGTVDPEPEPPVKLPTKDTKDEGQAEAASDSRGLTSTFTRMVRTIVSRPAWWVSILLLLGSAVALVIIRKRRGGHDKHVPYGIHRDKE